MPNRAGRAVASPARSWLLAICALTFALGLWNMFAWARYAGYRGIDDVPSPVAPLETTVTLVWPRSAGARAGIHVGDKLEYPPRDSISQGVKYRHSLAGQPVPMRVTRDGRVFYTSVVPISVMSIGQSMSWRFRLDNLANWGSAVFASIVAWFGVGRRARLLSWLLIFGALSGWLNPTDGFISPWPWLNEIAYLLNAPTSVLSSALLATLSSTFGRPIGRSRRILEWSTYLVTIVGVGAVVVLYELIAITPWFDQFWPFVNSQFTAQGLAAASYLLAAACAFAALASVHGEERQRAAWLLTPLGALFTLAAIETVASAFAGGFYGGNQQALAIAGDIVQIVLLVIMTYAVLSRRLLDVQFVINRAAVFAGVSLVVVGIFVLAEFLFNKIFTEASRTTSIVVSVGIALAVGLSMQLIHRYVDKVVDLVFFRERHEHEHSLRAFAHEAAFITDLDTLLDNTVHEVAINGETERVSILLRDEGETYMTARSTTGETDVVSENDRAILKLRAWHTPIDLDDVETEISGSRAYPLISRGDLLGILVCGEKRDGQQYAPDEDDALSALARGVGSSLDGLRRERGDDLKASIEDLRIGMLEIRDALRYGRDGRPPETQIS